MKSTAECYSCWTLRLLSKAERWNLNTLKLFFLTFCKTQLATFHLEAAVVLPVVLSSPTVGQVPTSAVVTHFEELSTCETADSLRLTEPGLKESTVRKNISCTCVSHCCTAHLASLTPEALVHCRYLKAIILSEDFSTHCFVFLRLPTVLAHFHNSHQHPQHTICLALHSRQS